MDKEETTVFGSNDGENQPTEKTGPAGLPSKSCLNLKFDSVSFLIEFPFFVNQLPLCLLDHISDFSINIVSRFLPSRLLTGSSLHIFQLAKVRSVPNRVFL